MKLSGTTIGSGLAVLLLGIVIFAGCGNSDMAKLTAEQRATVADSVLALSEAANRAWQNLDPEDYMSYYGADAHFYFQGAYYSRDTFEEIVYSYLGQLRESSLTMINPIVDVLGPNGAVISYEYTGYNADTTGRVDSTRAAFTAVFKKEQGEWLIVQAHESMVPLSNGQ
ncbi:MAG: nuclear transport factor 2 family protein [Balneolaceae bacterium]|nr:nuclear transport factor 2 family protein [Balneolaceae bacterium]